VEKWVEALKNKDFFVHTDCGEKDGFSTGNRDKTVFHNVSFVFHGKKSGNVEKLSGLYLRLLILVVMALTVSAKLLSFSMRSATCSMECLTVAWSRSPNSRPISLRE